MRTFDILAWPLCQAIRRRRLAELHLNISDLKNDYTYVDLFEFQDESVKQAFLDGDFMELPDSVQAYTALIDSQENLDTYEGKKNEDQLVRFYQPLMQSLDEQVRNSSALVEGSSTSKRRRLQYSSPMTITGISRYYIHSVWILFACV